MKLIPHLRGQALKQNLRRCKAAVLGLGKSGISSALCLARTGARVFLSDSERREKIWNQIPISLRHLPHEFGGHGSKILEQDLVIGSGQVEGAARHVVGERMDCAGMRWLQGKGEALLQLRCLELNGDWDRFIGWVQGQNQTRL